jgi:PAS domain S-box-containing protein
MNTLDPIERSHELNAQSHRILVIDDNPRIHEDFRKVLCPQSASKELEEDEAVIYGRAPVMAEDAAEFEIDSAFQGREGLGKVEQALAETRPYSLAFVDVRMPPGWDGIQTIKNIWKVYPELQVVICTAYSDHSFQDILQTLGRSDSLLILKKPFDNVEVLQLAHALTKKWVVTCQARFRREQLESEVERRTQDLARANKQLQAELKKRCETEQELRETARSLRSSEEHLRLAGQVLGAGTYEYDLVNFKRFLSPALRAMYRLDEDESTPFKAFSERMVVEDRAGFLAAVAGSRDPASDGRFDHVHRVRQPDGTLRWLHSQAQTWFEGEGEERHPVMVVGVVIDVTERKRAEETSRPLSIIVESPNDTIIGETPGLSKTAPIITHNGLA